MKIVSADSHVVEPQEALPPGVAYQAEGRLVVCDPKRYACPPLYVGPALAAGEPARLLKGHLSLERRPGAWQASWRRDVQKLSGLDAEVLYPTFSLTLVETAVGSVEATAAADRYNGWVLNNMHEPSLQPLILASDLTDDGRFYIKWADSRGLPGVLMPFPKTTPDIWIPACEELFVHAAACEVPLHWHAFSRPSPSSFGVHPLKLGWAAFQEGQGLLVDLILGGVFERHPKLKVVLAEMDAGWVWHTARRLHSYCERYRELCGRERPVDVWGVLAENVFFAINSVHDYEKAKMANPKVNLMWGWDWPHVDAVQMPDTRFAHDKLMLRESWDAVQRVYPRLAGRLEGADA